MKPYLKCMSIMLLCSTFLQGCAEAKPSLPPVNENSSEVINENVVQENLEETALHVSNPQYNPETDNPGYLFDASIAPIENGIYFFEDDLLCFHDYQSNKTVPVCGRANCNHETNECDAYFDMSTYKTASGIWYYCGQLYLIGTDSSHQEYKLYRVNGDGTNREEIAELFNLEGKDEMLDVRCLHRGYFYFSVTNDSYTVNAKLFRVALEKGAKPELLYEGYSDHTEVYRGRGYGDGIFFQVGQYPKNPDDEFVSAVYYVDHDKNVTKIKQDVEMSYCIIDGLLYYTTNDSIRRYDFEACKDELFLETGRVCNVSADSKYIYLDDYLGTLLTPGYSTSKREISVWTRMGEKVDAQVAPMENADLCYFGDDHYMWMIWFGDSFSQSYLGAYDKSQIGTDSQVWENWSP